MLRAHTGEAGGPELVAAVERLPLAAIDDLAEALLAEPSMPKKAAPRNEVWPLVNARASVLSRGLDSLADAPGSVGLNLSAAMDPRQVGENTFSDGVVRALLYSHGLVLEDPLAMAADSHRGPAAARAHSRESIVAAAVSLVEIEDLLEAGIVETFFVSGKARRGDAPLRASMYSALGDALDLDVGEIWGGLAVSGIDGSSEPLTELWRAIRALRGPSSGRGEDLASKSEAEAVEAFIGIVANLWPDSALRITFETIVSGLADIRHLGGHHDLLCPSPLYARLLFLGSPDPEAELRVHQLARTSVPNLEELGMSDIVAIRKSSDALDAWRAQLSLGLDHAHRLREELGPGTDLSAAVSEVLAETRQRFLAEKKRSRVFGRAGWTAFVAGAIGGLVPGAPGGTTSGLIGAAGGVVGALTQGLLDAGPEIPDFAGRHYLVFDRATAESECP